MVTVESARIAALAAGKDRWDGVDSNDGGARSVEALATMMSLASPPVGALLGALGKFVPTTTPGDDASYPDPYIQITFNESVGARVARSAVLVNTIRPSWKYSFYVRLDTLRDSGIDIAVADDDGEAAGANIGAINVPRAQLSAVAASGRTSAIESASGELEQVAVRFEPVIVGSSSAVRQYPLDLSVGVVTTDIEVPQGSLITVRATGSGSVGTGFSCKPNATPQGIPDGDCRNYNLSGWAATESAPHGSAVALVGSAPVTQAVSLVSEAEGPQCVRFLAPASGPLAFAINDRDFSNNNGEYGFELQVEPPPEGADVVGNLGVTTACGGSSL